MSAFVLAELRAAGLPSHGWMFPRRDGKPGPCTPWLVSHLAGRGFHEAGSAATLHMARHRVLTLVYRETRALTLVQELAGHPNPSAAAGKAAHDHGRAPAAVGVG